MGKRRRERRVFPLDGEIILERKVTKNNMVFIANNRDGKKGAREKIDPSNK